MKLRPDQETGLFTFGRPIQPQQLTLGNQEVLRLVVSTARPQDETLLRERIVEKYMPAHPVLQFG